VSDRDSGVGGGGERVYDLLSSVVPPKIPSKMGLRSFSVDSSSALPKFEPMVPVREASVCEGVAAVGTTDRRTSTQGTSNEATS
jgi:hypothetical protein